MDLGSLENYARQGFRYLQKFFLWNFIYLNPFYTAEKKIRISISMLG